MIVAIGISFGSCDRISGHKEAPELEYTTYDVVSQRRMEQDKRSMLETYYSIPEPVLIQILNRIGTNTTKENIVFEYKNNKDYYQGVIDGISGIKELTPTIEELPIPPKIKMPEEVIEK